MKDTVDELIQRLYDGYDYEIHEDLLRRFGELEKENESLRCCGNCKIYDGGWCNIKNEPSGAWSHCDKWQTDSLTRAERQK